MTSAALETPDTRTAAKVRVDELRAGGWSMDDIARAVEVSWWTVYRWSRGENEPRPLQRSTLFRLPLQRAA